MLGAIYGDKAGSIYEFNQTINIESINPEKLILPNSFYSDDTIETIAVIDAIINNKDYEDTLRKYILENIEYRPNFKPYFKTSFSPGTIKWAKGIGRNDSIGNGAIMRISPVGYLFNSENVNKDFLVSFNISSGTYASSYNTLFNAFDEAKANGYYYGVIFRYHNSNSSNYQIVSYVNDTTNNSANVAISGTTNVRIKRESKVISYSINNGSWTTLQSFASTNATVNTPATFGSSWNGSGPYRYFTGTLTDMNIYVYD